MTFELNPDFLEEVAAEPGVLNAIGEATEAVASAAQDAAPVGTGDYVDSIEHEVADGKGRVFTTDFAGHIVEWGSVNNPPYAPLRTGARNAGLDLEEE